MGLFDKIFKKKENINPIHEEEGKTTVNETIKSGKDPYKEMVELGKHSLFYQGSIEALEVGYRLLKRQEGNKGQKGHIAMEEQLRENNKRVLESLLLKCRVLECENRSADEAEAMEIYNLLKSYCTPQEFTVKLILVRLQEEKDEASFRTGEEHRLAHQKLEQAYTELKEMLRIAKLERASKKLVKDPDIKDRKPDKLGNPTEPTLGEKATRIIEKLIREGTLEREFAEECHLSITDSEKDDDYDPNVYIEDVD